MTAERWQEVKRIATDALQFDPAARAEFVARVCGGDQALQGEINLLLAQDGDVIEDLAAQARTQLAAEGDSRFLGQRLGAYQILREIGRGGMGAVYLAERADEEFRKTVAIKLLKRGTDTDEVLQRFRAEREILARLEHPNIARLLDGGTTEDGLPYFIMEYVEGEPLMQFCSAHALTMNARLELFLKICAAVQFAHQHLIVHRDLKPRNILVTPEGDPKLLDFGIAKLLAPDEEALLVTMAGEQRLTAAYASPEQVRGEPITTGSDIYTLGALLYEVLTGQNAHRFSTPHPQPTELLRVVAQDQPLRPSTAATDLANKRRLRGDLDNIILKALRKDPRRRYESVGALAADLRRHLENRPVVARPDTVSYRTSKFVQRNKLGVAAAVLLLLALLGGVIATSWEAYRARLAEAKAQQRFAQVRELAHSVLFDYHDEIAALPGSTKVRARLVNDALRYLDNLSKEGENDTSLLRELASAYGKVAAVQGGAATSRQKLLSVSNLGDTKGGLETELKATAIWQRIARLTPNDEEVQRELVGAYGALGYAYLLLGAPEKAADYYRKSIQVGERLLAANPQNEAAQYLQAANYIGLSKALGNPGTANLGDKRGAMENKGKAEVVVEKLAAEHPTNPDYRVLLASLHNMGALMSDDSKRGLEESSQAVAIYEALVEASPDNATYRRQLAIELGNIGSYLLKTGDQSGALQKIKEAQAIYDALIQADPEDSSIRGAAALNLRKLGSAQGTKGDHAAAFMTFQKAQQILAELVAQDANNAEFRRQWAYAYLAMSRDQLEAGDANSAAASAAQGIKIEEELVAASPTNITAQNTLGLLYSQLGAAEEKAGSAAPFQNENWHAAEVAFQKSLAVWKDLQAKGALNAADADKAGEAAQEVALCEARLSPAP